MTLCMNACMHAQNLRECMQYRSLIACMHCTRCMHACIVCFAASVEGRGYSNSAKFYGFCTEEVDRDTAGVGGDWGFGRTPFGAFCCLYRPPTRCMHSLQCMHASKCMHAPLCMHNSKHTPQTQHTLEGEPTRLFP